MRINKRLIALSLATIGCVSTAFATSVSTTSSTGDDDNVPGLWRFYGKNIHNTSYPVFESTITPQNASQLKVKWIYKTVPDGDLGVTGLGGSVTATPSVADGTVYFPDYAGNIHAVDAKTGTAKWVKNLITDYSNDPKMKGLKVAYSRTTPAIVDGMLIIGCAPTANAFEVSKNGAVLIAVNRKDGSLLWSTQLDNHPLARITQSAVVYNGTIYVGVSTSESGMELGGSVGPTPVPGTSNTYNCCSFRGSFLAVDVNTGKIKWKTYTLSVPDATQASIEKDWSKRPTGVDKSYSGASVWGSTPVIDIQRNTVYIGTGQTHNIPNKKIAGFPSNTTFPLNKIVNGNYSAAIVALDMTTGKVKWARNLGKVANSGGLDAWNSACVGPFLSSVANIGYCPNTVNTNYTDPNYNDILQTMPFSSIINVAIPNQNYNYEPFPLPNPGLNGPLAFDHDFGQGPMLVNAIKMPNGKYKDLLIAPQKSGWTRALDPDTGATIWATFEGPGGAEGGHEWGSATDSKRVYLANNNVIPGPYFTQNGSTTITGPYWSALDVSTGKILWENANPANLTGLNPFNNQPTPAPRTGAVTVTNGVVFAGARDTNGTMVAMDASNGNILWSYQTAQNAPTGKSAINSRPAVVGGTVYWGAGSLSGFFNYEPNLSHNRVYAFEIPGCQ
ncbi:MAG: PQQ-binding-like beta-propeller repeat protein [Proteobacteria bacterium]|nr:PQQ-binding-like beta-propeller repeat protein [Pseudomonadota bacterium]